jgi:CelD/BcsL family acetyltransferase involved in cellulose biosynthesis
MRDCSLTYGIHCEPESLSGLRGKWDDLCRRVESDVAVFATPAWYESWWKHYGEGNGLNLFTMWEGDRLVGIAPLIRSSVSLHGLPARSIGFIQNNQALHNDFIVEPEFRGAFFEGLLLSLFEQAPHWDVLFFRNISTDSDNNAALLRVLDAQKRRGKIRPNNIDSPYLVPAGDWESYLKGRTRRTQKSIRNIRNRIDASANVSVRNITTWDEYLARREDIFKVALLSWAESVGDSLGSDANRDFYESLSRDAAERGWLSIWILYLDDVAVAVEYHLKAFGREHALRGHCHPDFASLSPGTYLETKILEDLFKDPQSVRTYDFCGGFESYKKKWTEHSSPHCDMFIFRESMLSRVALQYEFKVVPWLKSMIEKRRKAA